MRQAAAYEASLNRNQVHTEECSKTRLDSVTSTYSAVHIAALVDVCFPSALIGPLSGKVIRKEDFGATEHVRLSLLPSPRERVVCVYVCEPTVYRTHLNTQEES